MMSRNSNCRCCEYLWNSLKIVVIENEILRIEILADKGTDIVEFLYKPEDIDFMWRSPIPLYNRFMFPITKELDSGNFIDFYPGGWQEIFPNGSSPCEYKGTVLGLHGEIALLPWDYKIIEDSSEKISVLFSVKTYRTPFYIEKIISIEKEKPYIEIEEKVKNIGGEDMDFIWGHHPAIGKPFLSSDCFIKIPECKIKVVPGDGKSITNLKQTEGIWPYLEGIDGNKVDISKIPSENDCISDMMFLTDLKEGKYEIVNKKRKLSFFFEFPLSVFKCLWFWRIAKGSFNYPWYGRNYNIALEPFSSLPNLAEAIKRGDQLKLKPDEEMRVKIKAGVIKEENG
ncbi:MAG TPA: DUF4432 family protein [Candidatus Ratteibacteria bacterium]|nr:DUF4432 family protein [Candidatus Ratteibacteria bacterium]